MPGTVGCQCSQVVSRVSPWKICWVTFRAWNEPYEFSMVVHRATNACIRVVLFDVGGVIVPAADPALVLPLENQLCLRERSLSAFLFEQEPWYALSTGRIDHEQYWNSLAKQIGWDAHALRNLLSSIHTPPVVDRQVVEIARAVSSQVPVAILSNATSTLEEQLSALGVASLFDPVINSARVGLRKPDREIFRYAIRILGVPAGTILFVDDKERNTVVAEDLGIRCIQFSNAEQLATAVEAYGISPR